MVEEISARLLVIDDNEDVGRFLSKMGNLCGYQADHVENIEDCESYLKQFNPDIITLDLQMPETDGVEFLRWLSSKECKSNILLISGMDNRTLSSSMDLGKHLGLNIIGTLQKPVQISEIKSILKRFIEKNKKIIFTENDLEDALKKEQFVVYYQPRISIDSQIKTVCGVEALVRWQNEDGSIISPGEFIPLAERTGQIREITWQVLDIAFKDLVEWEKQDLNLSVSLNIAQTMLDDYELPEKIYDTAVKYGVNTGCVILEITESAAMKDVFKSMDILTRLRIKGFQISLDDFGTGFSSLVHLYRLPFSEIKIDHTFVKDILQDKEAQTIVHACIDLAKNLGMSSCAEGVENEEVLNMLEGYGCNQQQGYLFSEAIPSDSLVHWLAGWNEATKNYNEQM